MLRMLNFPQLAPVSACMSLVRRGVTALTTGLFFRETAEGWEMNFAAQPAKSCCFSTVLPLLD